MKKKQGRKDIEKSKEHFTRFTEHDTKKKKSIMGLRQTGCKTISLQRTSLKCFQKKAAKLKKEIQSYDEC